MSWNEGSRGGLSSCHDHIGAESGEGGRQGGVEWGVGGVGGEGGGGGRGHISKTHLSKTIFFPHVEAPLSFLSGLSFLDGAFLKEVGKPMAAVIYF